ncbi:MAG: CDP-alcohol phosphatidyltransferase family protein [Cytophagales bacterium]|nr:CDP-alcohol phosphatidyltransferase family protein [Cytophagales bacterium]
MRYRIAIPTLLSTLNLFSGFCGIFFVFVFEGEEKFMYAVSAIWVGCFFDLLDGAVARYLDAMSDFGKELDSMADSLSFGLLPACFFYQFFSEQSFSSSFSSLFLLLLSFFLLSGTVFRLIRFNLSASKSHTFQGLPSPAHAIWISSLVFMPPWGTDHVSTPYLWLGIALFSTLSMMLNLRFPSFKNIWIHVIGGENSRLLFRWTRGMLILLLVGAMLYVLGGLCLFWGMIAYVAWTYLGWVQGKIRKTSTL